MTWWIIAAVVVLVAILFYKSQRYHHAYLDRTSQRLSLLDRSEDEIARHLADGTLTDGKLLRLEGQLHAAWQAQLRERPPEPEKLNKHRDHHAKRMEFAYLKARDIRTTGGTNIAAINRKEDFHLAIHEDPLNPKERPSWVVSE